MQSTYNVQWLAVLKQSGRARQKDIVKRKEKDKRHRQLPTVVTPLLQGQLRVVVTKDLVMMLRTYFYLFRLQ